MMRACLALAVLCEGLAWAQAPSYSAASIVNGANFTAGAAAPNSFLSLFGSNLAWDAQPLTTDLITNGCLPISLAGVQVWVGSAYAPLYYVSPTQINLLIPANLKPGPVTLRVVRQGVTGPEITLTLASAAPQLFATTEGYLIAQHADYSLINPDAPAHPGEVIVVYAIGLGQTAPQPEPGEIPTYPGWMTQLSDLQVTVGGVALTPDRIWYAGLTPGWPGLYQINLVLPDPLDANPELLVAVGSQVSSTGLKLAATSEPAPPAPQPSAAGKRYTH